MQNIEAAAIIENHVTSIEAIARNHGAPYSHTRATGCLSAAARNRGDTIHVTVYLTPDDWQWGNDCVNGSYEKRRAMKAEIKKYLDDNGVKAELRTQRISEEFTQKS
jgi:hypothetical protein